MLRVDDVSDNSQTIAETHLLPESPLLYIRLRGLDFRGDSQEVFDSKLQVKTMSSSVN
jgi:hypothetical protein